MGCLCDNDLVINKLKNSKILTELLETKESQLSLVEIKPGVGTPIIFIDGFLTEEKDNTDDWESQLKDI